MRRAAGPGGAGRGTGGADEIPELAGAILDVVDLVPAGRVVTYGDVAEYLGRGGPRTVGSAMARWGGAVAWWRVVSADGSPVAAYRAEALRHLRAEGTPLRPDGRRVDLTRARWNGEPGTGTP
ncbi:MAG: cysteine methyltransferase [Actinomycetales bacterium]|nr:cysteine methyltransferase [Actinomycetales bacterium]